MKGPTKFAESKGRVTVYYCKWCGWHSEPAEGARVNKCDDCRLGGLLYVTYDPEIEQEEADRILANAAINAPGERLREQMDKERRERICFIPANHPVHKYRR